LHLVSLRSPLDKSGSTVGPRFIGGLRLAWGWLSSFSIYIHRGLVYRALDNFEERVIDRRLRLLDTRDVITRGVDTKIHSFGAYHLSAIVASQPYCQQPLLLCLLEGHQYIDRIAAC